MFLYTLSIFAWVDIIALSTWNYDGIGIAFMIIVPIGYLIKKMIAKSYTNNVEIIPADRMALYLIIFAWIEVFINIV